MTKKYLKLIEPPTSWCEAAVKTGPDILEEPGFLKEFLGIVKKKDPDIFEQLLKMEEDE